MQGPTMRSTRGDLQMALRNLFRFRCLLWFLAVLLACALVDYLLVSWQTLVRAQEARLHFLGLIPKNLTSLPLTDERTCRCQRRTLGAPPTSNASSCDGYATARGPGQRVSSYSLYGDATSTYFRGVWRNAEETGRLYPGWVMRVYHSVDTGCPEQLAALCQLWCNFTHLDLCQVGRLPPPLGNQSGINGMLWRFFPLGDPLVDRFIVRDLDSLPSHRELAAVNDWIGSNRTWHFMRDHEQHNVPILGGMWGGMNRDLHLAISLRQLLIGDGDSYYKGADQDILKKHLYPVAKGTQDFVGHDSYFCSWFDSRPWPTRREADLGFVGDAVLVGKSAVQQKCPVECRPKEHKDWEYC